MRRRKDCIVLYSSLICWAKVVGMGLASSKAPFTKSVTEMARSGAGWSCACCWQQKYKTVMLAARGSAASLTGTDVWARKKSGCLNAGFISGSLEKNSCYYLSAKLIFNWIVWAFFNFKCQEINNLSTFLSAFWSIENMNLNSVWCFKIGV